MMVKVFNLNKWTIILTLFVMILGSSGRADVDIVRDDPENPFTSIAKSTVYGALMGSVVAAALMLATRGDDDDIFKWSFISGASLGLGFGIYHVLVRPAPTKQAALQFNGLQFSKLTVPHTTVKFRKGSLFAVDVPVISVKF